MSPMKILFAGTPEPAAVALEHLLADPRIEVAGVLTQPDAPRGRGRTVYPSKVAEVAEKHGLAVHKWASLKKSTEENGSAETLRDYAERGVQAVAVVAYGNLIPRDLLDVFPHGWVNLHFSLLPRWRGAAPVQAALAAGDASTGATIFRIEEGLDTGPMLSSYEEKIELTDTADDLLTRLTMQGRELLADTLTSLHEGTAEYTDQDESQSTHAAKIHSADARIDWSQPAEVIQRVARAHTPAPGAWTMLGEQRFKIGLLLPNAEEALPAGQMVFHNKKLLVGTGTDVLEIVTIQPPGKKMMQAADWARGQHALQEAPQQFENIQDGTNGHAEGHN